MSDLPFSTKSLSSITFSKVYIYEAPTSLNATKAIHGDWTPPIVIKQFVVSFLDPVQYIFTNWMEES